MSKTVFKAKLNAEYDSVTSFPTGGRSTSLFFFWQSHLDMLRLFFNIKCNAEYGSLASYYIGDLL